MSAIALIDCNNYYVSCERAFVRDIGLIPYTTPVSSPQSNGRAEAFDRTLKRDYVRVNATPDARTVIEQLAAWFAHYNDVHSHRALRYRSRREFIALTRKAASRLWEGGHQQPGVAYIDGAQTCRCIAAFS